MKKILEILVVAVLATLLVGCASSSRTVITHPAPTASHPDWIRVNGEYRSIAPAPVVVMPAVSAPHVLVGETNEVEVRGFCSTTKVVESIQAPSSDIRPVMVWRSSVEEETYTTADGRPAVLLPVGGNHYGVDGYVHGDGLGQMDKVQAETEPQVVIAYCDHCKHPCGSCSCGSQTSWRYFNSPIGFYNHYGFHPSSGCYISRGANVGAGVFAGGGIFTGTGVYSGNCGTRSGGTYTEYNSVGGQSGSWINTGHAGMNGGRTTTTVQGVGASVGAGYNANHMSQSGRSSFVGGTGVTVGGSITTRVRVGSPPRTVVQTSSGSFGNVTRVTSNRSLAPRNFLGVSTGGVVNGILVNNGSRRP